MVDGDSSVRQVVFVPAAGSPPGLSLMLKPLADGRRSLLVYTSQERFIAGCGANQRWAAVYLDRIDDLFVASEADVVALDADMEAWAGASRDEGES